MKKLKFILCVGILGVMTYGGITAYNHLTMTEQERLLLANVEALTSGETGGGNYCTQHWPCFNNYGSPTGKYSASSYAGCSGSYHSHPCTSCRG